MNKLEIKTYLKREKELFIKLDIDYIIKNSSYIGVNDIHGLIFESNLFPNFDNKDNNAYYNISIVIIDKNDNIVKSLSINKSFNDNKIKLNINNIENTKVLDEYFLYVSLIPINEENKELIKKFVKAFYSSPKLYEKKIIIKNKIGMMMPITLLFSIFFTTLQVNIIIDLINDYGFVDNIINNLTIFNSTVSYFYDIFFIKNLNLFLILYLIGFIIFLFPSCINLIANLISYIFKIVFLCSKNKYLYFLTILKNDITDIKSNLKEVILNPNFIFKYTLIYIFTMLLLFAPIMKSFSNENRKNDFNIKGKIIEKYLNASVFPLFVSIEKELTHDNILIIGYDSVYTYYYEYKYIKDKLDKKFKPFEKEKYNYKEIPLSEIYAYSLYDVSKSELKYIKNTEYKIIEEIKEKYYLLELKENKTTE